MHRSSRRAAGRVWTAQSFACAAAALAFLPFSLHAAPPDDASRTASSHVAPACPKLPKRTHVPSRDFHANPFGSAL